MRPIAFAIVAAMILARDGYVRVHGIKPDGAGWVRFLVFFGCIAGVIFS